MPRKGFKLPERIVTLVFEDGPYQGLEIDVDLTTPMRYYWRLMEWAENPPKDMEEIRSSMLDWARRHLRGWNLQDREGKPVPATPDSYVNEIDRVTQATILGKWREAVANPPVPKSQASRNGATSGARTKSRSR